MREVWEGRPVLAKSYVNVSVFPEGRRAPCPVYHHVSAQTQTEQCPLELASSQSSFSAYSRDGVYQSAP